MKNPLSVESLIDWLRTKEPTQQYCYASNHNCLLSQYFNDKGFGPVVMGSLTWSPANNPTAVKAVPEHFNYIAWGGHEGFLKRTYADALERALACCDNPRL